MCLSARKRENARTGARFRHSRRKPDLAMVRMGDWEDLLFAWTSQREPSELGCGRGREREGEIVNMHLAACSQLT